jgi:hypothetical protein
MSRKKKVHPQKSSSAIDKNGESHIDDVYALLKELSLQKYQDEL